MRQSPWRRGAEFRTRLLACALLVIGVLLAGCSPPSAPTSHASPAPRATPAPLDPGWIVHTDSGAGFRVAFPDAYDQAQRDSPTLSADLAAIADRNPELGPYFRDNLTGAGLTGPALLAADPRTLSLGYATNLAVFRSNLGPVARAPDLEGVRQGKIRALGKDNTIVGAINQRRTRLAGVEAQRLAYVFKSGTHSVEVLSYLLLVSSGTERVEYELTMGTAITDYAKLFDKISSSFALVPVGSVSPSPSAPAGSPAAAPQPSPSG